MGIKTFKIVTLGCKVNQYESAFLKDSLLNEGWCNVSKDVIADMTIVNTCIVTQRASYQSRQAIRKALRENPSGKVSAIGCYGQVFPEELSQIEGLHLITGNTEKAQLPKVLHEMMESVGPQIISGDFEQKKDFDFLPIKSFLNRTRSFLKIQDGCESFCSYCIVPYARGPQRSLDPDKVIRMLEKLSVADFKEVVLTGVHLGKYGIDMDGGEDLKGLLKRIGKQGLPIRVRLSSLEPTEIDRELIEMIESEKWICSHFHIPLQSGDNGILEKMNRSYKANEFANLIERIHRRVPLAAIGVDVMAGFPGEDKKAYRNTYALIDALPVSYLHVFPFSPRKGTSAWGFPDRVDQGLIKERAGELRTLGKEKRRIFHRLCLGREFSVLAEGWASDNRDMIKGLSDNYLRVVFPSSCLVKNKLVKIRIEEVGQDSVSGKTV